MKLEFVKVNYNYNLRFSLVDSEWFNNQLLAWLEDELGQLISFKFDFVRESAAARHTLNCRNWNSLFVKSFL